MPLIHQPIDGVTPGDPANIQDGGPGITSLPIFQPAAGCAKVANRFEVEGQPAENVMWFYVKDQVWTYDLLNALNVSIQNRWIEYCLPLQAPSVRMIQTSSRAWTKFDGDATAEKDYAADTLGTNMDAAPEENSACIGLAIHTGFVGRSYNGRIFMAGMTENDFLLSIPVAASKNAWEVAFALFVKSVVIDVGARLVVVSFINGKKKRAAANVVLAAGLTAGEWIYTMRRRLPGHNRHR